MLENLIFGPHFGLLDPNVSHNLFERFTCTSS